MILIYYINNFGVIPVTTAANIKIAKEYIERNQGKYTEKLNHRNIGYEWR